MKDLIVKERKGFPISLKGFSKLSTSTNLGDAYKVYTFTNINNTLYIQICTTNNHGPITCKYKRDLQLADRTQLIV